MTYKTATNSQRIPLKDITLMIKRGITPKYTDVKGIEVINQRCIRDSRINLELVRLNDTDKRKISEEKYLQKYDVLVNSTGVGTLGRVAQYLISEKTKRTVDSHVTIVRPIKNIDPIYFGYAIRNEEILIESLGEGSTGQTELSRHRLGEEIRINVPSSEEQKAIANILSSLDDKIEINNAIIANLEEQAQAIFKSWFVDFEPFQDSDFIKSELGELPEKWGMAKLSNLFEIKYGKNLPTKKLEEEGFPVFGGNGQIGYYHEYLFKEPKLLISCRGAASGKVLVSLPNSFITNNSLVMNEFNRDYFHYFKYLFNTIEFENYATGSAQPQITISNIKDIEVVVPTEDIIKKFNKLLNPFFTLQLNLKKENIRLEETRDTLLPKLMSGEIRVEEATKVN